MQTGQTSPQTDHPPIPLTGRQEQVLTEISRYYSKFGKGCSLGYLAVRLKITRHGPRCHLDALWKKGWLASPHTPAEPSPSWLSSSTYRVGFLTRS